MLVQGSEETECMEQKGWDRIRNKSGPEGEGKAFTVISLGD